MRNVLLVRGLRRIRKLVREPQRFVERQRSFERRAFHKLHDQVIWTDVVQRADVGMVERSYRSSLELEAFGELLFGSLDGDDAVEAGVAGLPHFSHAALADWLQNFVRPELVAWR